MFVPVHFRRNVFSPCDDNILMQNAVPIIINKENHLGDFWKKGAIMCLELHSLKSVYQRLQNFSNSMLGSSL